MKCAIYLLTPWLLLAIICCSPSQASAQNDFAPLLNRLPTDSHLVALVDLKGFVRVYRNFLDDFEKSPIMEGNAELKSQFSMSQAIVEGVAGKLKDQTGIDPLNDIYRAVVGFQLSGPEQVSLLLVIQGRFPEGFMARLFPGRKTVKQGSLDVLEMESDVHAVQSGDQVLVALGNIDLESVLKSKKGKSNLFERHPIMYEKTGPEFLYRNSFEMPGWLKQIVPPGLSFLRDLKKLTVDLDGRLEIVAETNSEEAAESWQYLLTGAGESMVAGLHFWRSYFFMMLGSELWDLAEFQIPPQLKSMWADRKALVATLEHFFPELKQSPTTTRKGKTVHLQANMGWVVGAFFPLGILGAIAIPSFISYIRKAKASEVNLNLDMCYKGAIDYYEREQVKMDGTLESRKLPESMPMVCPADAKDINGLDGSSSLLHYGQAKSAYQSIHWVITDTSYGCYRYELHSQPGKHRVHAFSCHAWTDIDDDDRPAHWTKTGTWDPTTKVIQAGPILNDGDEF